MSKGNEYLRGSSRTMVRGRTDSGASIETRRVKTRKGTKKFLEVVESNNTVFFQVDIGMTA